MIISLILNAVIILLFNYLGLKYHIFYSRVLHSNYIMTNPLYISFGICLFNIFNCKKYNNSFINNISKLSLVFYLIHENDLFRSFLRQDLFKYVNYFENVVLGTIIFSIVLFIGTILLSYIYSKTFGILSIKLSQFFNKIFNKITNRLEDKIFNEKK